METYSSLSRLISSNAVMSTVRSALPTLRLGDADLLRPVLEARVQARRHGLRRHLQPAQQRGDQPVLLFEQRQQQVLGLDGRMLQLLRRLLGGGQRFLGTLGESIQSHGRFSTHRCEGG